MSTAEHITTYGAAKRLSAQTLTRWQAWEEADQAALLTFAQELQLGENQLRDFLDWIEEIRARDGSRAYEILTQPGMQKARESQLSRNDKLKKCKEALRRLRYPRLSHLEDQLQAAAKALDLGQQVRIVFPPSLEGSDITIEIKVGSEEELAEVVHCLQQRLAAGKWHSLFELLDQV